MADAPYAIEPLHKYCAVTVLIASTIAVPVTRAAVIGDADASDRVARGRSCTTAAALCFGRSAVFCLAIPWQDKGNLGMRS
eukprot:CAMPEP_0197393646 /NCGR_PEP_ID=MMETSP1165-20131217/4440_1 /TAXON_ID=284809 /ORGANISM="Chrysocystis fragilis, Strain CCMP3189" /LENGTH=80 /DNA_ID=CAMNT_0042919321 /DNA_START=503 /DNA_END=745 /DNA_ORIENTATION=+